MSSVETAGVQEQLASDFVADYSFTLPGKGEKPESCGVYYPREFCDECGEPHFGASRCLNRSCPECWKKWSGDRAASIARRLSAGRYVGLWDRTETVRCSVATHTVSECSDCFDRRVRCDTEGHSVDACSDCFDRRVRCDNAGTEGHSVDECSDCFEERVRCEDHDPSHRVDACPDCFEERVRCEDYDPSHRVDECSECGEEAIEARTEGLKKRAVHAYVSAPEGEIENMDDVDRGFQKAYEMASEHGVRGGVCLFHGYRVTEEWKEQWAKETDGGDNGRKLWAWVRDHDLDWRQLVEWSPHWHILGLCDDFEQAEERADGWVIQNKRALSPFYLDEDEAEGYGADEPERVVREGYEDVIGTSRYLLSHTSFDPSDSVDSIRWFGELHPINFNPDPTDEERELESPLDEAEWGEIRNRVAELVGAVDEGGDSGGGEDFECDNCGSGSSSSIYEAGAALMDKGWCERIGREQRERLKVAFEWAIGDLEPPPGMKRPRTEQEAREAFVALL